MRAHRSLDPPVDPAPTLAARDGAAVPVELRGVSKAYPRRGAALRRADERPALSGGEAPRGGSAPESRHVRGLHDGGVSRTGAAALRARRLGQDRRAAGIDAVPEPAAGPAF